MNRTAFRRAAATIIVVPAVLLAAACGTDTKDAPAPAAASPSQSSSATPTSPAPVAAGEGDKAEFISALKAGAADAKSVHMDMSSKGKGQSLKVDGDTKLDGDNTTMQMKMGLAGMDLQMRLVDKKVYLKGLPNLPAGKWAEFDENSKTGKQMAQSVAQADPSKTYAQLEKAVTKVKKVGTDDVDGEQMTKYEVTLDGNKMVEGTSQAGAAPATVEQTIWVDSKNHVRKITGEVMGIKTSVDMSKYGEPVDIQAPSAKDVVKGKDQ